MRKARGPADGAPSHEELVRRWEELMGKHFLPKKGARKLAILVRLRQRLESQDPELRFEHITPEEAPLGLGID
jgi:hypothetical protein